MGYMARKAISVRFKSCKILCLTSYLLRCNKYSYSMANYRTGKENMGVYLSYSDNFVGTFLKC